MAELSKKFQKITQDIEEKIKDPEQLDFINKKIFEVSMIYMEIMDEMTKIINERLEGIEKVQEVLDEKLNTIQNSVLGIENDMYEDTYDFEIVCPYCNNQFIADIEEKKSIMCPECQNVIELEWNAEDELEYEEDGIEENNCCGGNCSGCSGCNSQCKNSYTEEELEELFYERYKKEHNDDEDL